MNLTKWIFAFFTSTKLLANLTDPDVQVATEGDPSATLCESVSLLSGDFVAFAEDHVIPGAQPISLRRHYVSGDGKGELAGWVFFPHLKLEMITEKKKKTTWKDYSRLVVAEPNGTRLVFKRQEKIDPKYDWVQYRIDFKKHGKGITNTARGTISGRTNLRNHRLVQESHYRILLKCADGTERCYRRTSEGVHPTFSLRYEILPNGNKVQYRYDDEERLSEVYTTNKKSTKTYAWCRFQYKGRHDVKIVTSDGKKLKYTFKKTGKKKDRQYLLTNVKTPSKPEEAITYDKQGRVTERTFPDRRRIAVEYYEPNTTYQVSSSRVSIGGPTYDPKCYRVKTLLRSTGVGGHLMPSHYFVYDLENLTTTIFDAEGNKTAIEYNENFQPCRIKYYDGETLHHTIEQKWGEYGQLAEKTELDKGGNPLITRKYKYDDRGNPIKIKLEGNICGLGTTDRTVETLVYDDENRLIETTTPTGLTTKITYVPATNLVEQKITTDEKGLFLRERYTYDEDNILIATTIDDKEEEHTTKILLKQESPLQNLPEEIQEYAQGCLLIKVLLTYNAAAQVIKKETYDANDKLTKTEAISYDERGRPIEQTDPIGQTHTYQYDQNNNLVKESNNRLEIRRFYDNANRLYHETRQGGGHSRTIQIEYDLKSRKEKERNSFGQDTHYTYTPFDQVKTVKHPNGSIETYTYDPLGHLIVYTNPLGDTINTITNIHGSPLQILHPDGTEESFTYYPDGLLRTHTNQIGTTATYTYDSLGRETSVTLDNITTTSTYDSLHLRASQDREGIITHYTYDFAGRKESETRGDKKITFAYDSLGRVHRTDQNGLITLYTYNDLDQLIEETIADQTTRYIYDPNGNPTSIIRSNGTETTTYDPFNRPITHTDPEGNQTHITYDETDTLIKTITDPQGTQTIETHDTLLHLTRKQIITRSGILIFDEEYERDDLGQVILQKCHIYEEGIYFRTLHIEKTYDALSRITSILEGENTPEERRTDYTYTPTGSLSRVTKPDGTRLSYTYNALDQLIRLHSSDNTIDYSYTYSPSGHLLTSYDAIQNLTTTRTLDTDGNLLSETLGNGLTLHSTYDPLDRRTTLTLPNDTTVTYTYKNLHLSTVTAFDQTATYTHNRAGNLIHLNNGIPIAYTYDRNNRPTHLTSPVYSQELTYDTVDNITTYEDDDSYYDLKYDRLNQLISEKNHTYAYDSLHNRLAKDDTPYTTNTIHALTQAGATTYTYDRNGNPLTKETPFGTTTYAYDALDRLIAVTTPTTHLRYIYDSEHRRIIKQAPTETTHFLYDGQDEIGSYTPDQTPLTLRILGDRTHAERQTLYIVLHNSLYLPITDLQGNIVRLHSPTASHAYRYNAFGEEHATPDHNPWRYASKRYDPETGLIHFGRRYYDPLTGRFLTPDPSPLTDSINLYAYTFNNPLTHLDLYGLFSLPDFTDMLMYRPPPADPSSMPYNSFEEDAYLSYYKNYFLPVDLNPNMSLRPQFEESSIYDLGHKKETPDRHILYVNGNLNDLDCATGSAKYFSALGGGTNIYGVHSATQGVGRDITHANILLNYQRTKTVELIREHLDNYFANASPNATMLIIAHSRGAAAVRNALMMYDKEQRSRIFVIAVSPAAFIDRKYCGDVIHYVSTMDVIDRADPYGRRTHESTIRYLRARGPMIDHGIKSPTFTRVLQQKITKYIFDGAISDD